MQKFKLAYFIYTFKSHSDYLILYMCFCFFNLNEIIFFFINLKYNNNTLTIFLNSYDECISSLFECIYYYCFKSLYMHLFFYFALKQLKYFNFSPFMCIYILKIKYNTQDMRCFTI